MKNEAVKRRRYELAELAEMPALDPVQFSSSTMDDVDLQREIVMLFQSQLANALQQLATRHLSQQDSKYLGHTLRGAAAALGAIEIEKIGQVWEECELEQSELLQLLVRAKTRFNDAVVSLIR